MVSEKEIIEWVKKNYGEAWARNPRLAKILYERANSKKNVYEVINAPTEVEIFSDIKDDGKYSIEVVVLDVQRKYKYFGCPKCKRKVDKGCVHLLKGEVEPVEILLISCLVTDKSGDIRDIVIYVMESEEFNEFDVGDLIKLNLYVRFRNDEMRLFVDSYEVIKRKSEIVDEKSDVVDDNVKVSVEEGNSKDNKVDDVKQILSILESVKSLGKLPFESMLRRKGLDIEDVEKYVVYDSTTAMYSLSEEGIKFLKGE